MSDEQVGFRKVYAIRRPMNGARSLEVTFPFELAEREARKRGLSVDEFIDKFAVQVELNDSAAVTYTIIPKGHSTPE